MSAAVLTDQIAILRQLFGEDAMARAAASLPEAERMQLRELTTVGWVEVDFAKAVYVAAAREVGRDVDAVHRDAVRAGVERTFRSFWRLILRMTTDNALVARTPLIYSKTHETGKLTSRVVAPGRAELWLDDWPGDDDFPLRGIATGIETTLRVAGRQGVKVNFERRQGGALFVASWRV